MYTKQIYKFNVCFFWLHIFSGCALWTFLYWFYESAERRGSIRWDYSQQDVDGIHLAVGTSPLFVQPKLRGNSHVVKSRKNHPLTINGCIKPSPNGDLIIGFSTFANEDFAQWNSSNLHGLLVVSINGRSPKIRKSYYQWIGLSGEIYRKPWFLPSKIGLSCKFFIIQFYDTKIDDLEVQRNR